MKIAVAKKSQNYNWHKSGDDIKYGKSHVIRRHSYDPAKVRYYSKLSFTYTFDATNTETGGDKVFLAYCFPYTFSKLTNFIREIS